MVSALAWADWQVAKTALGVGGLLVLGGAAAPWGMPDFAPGAMTAARRGCLGTVRGDVGNGGTLVLVVCNECCRPFASAPSTVCRYLRQRLAASRGGGTAEAQAALSGEESCEEGMEDVSHKPSKECKLYCPELDW